MSLVDVTLFEVMNLQKPFVDFVYVTLVEVVKPQNPESKEQSTTAAPGAAAVTA